MDVDDGLFFLLLNPSIITDKTITTPEACVSLDCQGTVIQSP